MDILVIGNGFDVAHGLPTKYDQFLDFVRYFRTTYRIDEDIKDIEASIRNYVSNLSDDAQSEYYNLIFDNVWFEHFIKTKEERKNTKQNWIDFEAEISDVTQELDRIRNEFNSKNTHNIKNFSYEVTTSYKNISSCYKNKDALNPNYMTQTRLNNIKEKFIKDLNRLTRCLELYLSDYLDIDSCKDNTLFSKTIQPDYVITFNYTDTYERLYMSNNFYSNELYYIIHEKKIHYIHGKAKKDNTIDDCDLVLGIEEYLEGDDRQKDNEYIEFKKFYQRIYKGTGSTYTNWLKKCNDTGETLNVIIYGHSIATTDGDIIKNLIEAAKTTTIYYYDKSALHDIILNLVQIIGEEKLIEMTSDDSKSGRIIFKPVP